jgi:CheY-like chemotaxis protein
MPGDGATAGGHLVLRPDAAGMDRHLPALDGIEATRQILAAPPGAS